MGYLSQNEIKKIGFKSYGSNLLISDKATFYRPERISLGSNIKIDDFAVLANNIVIGDFVHISISAYLLSSEKALIKLDDFSGVSHRTHIFTSSDNYSDKFLSGPIVGNNFTSVIHKSVTLEKHTILGAMSIILPGVILREGSTIGAGSVVYRSTKAWSVYIGNPAKKIWDRDRGVLEVEKEFRKNSCLNTSFLKLLEEKE